MPNCRLRPTHQGLSLPRKGIARRKLEPHPVQVSAECSKMSLKFLAHRKVGGATSSAAAVQGVQGFAFLWMPSLPSPYQFLKDLVGVLGRPHR